MSTRRIKAARTAVLAAGLCTGAVGIGAALYGHGVLAVVCIALAIAAATADQRLANHQLNTLLRRKAADASNKETSP